MMRRTSLATARATIAKTTAGACALAVVGLLATAPPAGAVAPLVAPAATFVDLGTAAAYSVLGGTGVTNTGTATVLAGNLGLSPTGVIAGFPPGTTHGSIHDKDAAAEQAQSDRQDAYDAAAAQTSTGAFAGDQAGAVFKPGVYTSAAAITNTGTMTLDADGDSSAVFVFQIGAAFSSAAASKIVVTDGALANNVYWQVSGAASIGAGAKVVGTFLGAGAIAVGEAASIKGRLLTTTTVSLANSPVIEPKDDLTAPLITIDGGATRSVDDATPPLSGTTDEPIGRPLSVTVGGQTLSTTVRAGGAWSVGTTTLTEGEHDVVATISDASQNTSTATQLLTVDVTAPVVTIDGGSTVATKDTTPTIAGGTDQLGDAPVTVTVGGQTLTTTATEGLWSVTTGTLDETSYGVVATVDDEAGNTGTSFQVLTVDLTTPVVTIDGGATRSTVDTSPWTYGTTGEQAGSVVHVTIGGQHLTTSVLADETWGVSAQTLAEGSYQVVASITDPGGNTGTATQMLTIGDGPVAPQPRHQPDAAVRVGAANFVGTGVYGGSVHQRGVATVRPGARTATVVVRLTNDGNAADAFTLRGTAAGAKFTVRYLLDGRNVTAAVVDGSLRTPSLQADDSLALTMKVTMTSSARPGNHRLFELRASSVHSPAKQDTVAAVARR